jgi:hypothetical protein
MGNSMIVSWGCAYGCNPCACRWRAIDTDEEGYNYILPLTDPPHIDMGEANFCFQTGVALPYIGIGCHATLTSDNNIGDSVSATLEVGIGGAWVGAAAPTVVPTYPDAVLFTLGTTTEITLDPSTGTVHDFNTNVTGSGHTTGGTPFNSGGWGASSTITLEGCIVANLLTGDTDVNAVYPFDIALPSTDDGWPANAIPIQTGGGLNSLGSIITITPTWLYIDVGDPDAHPPTHVWVHLGGGDMNMDDDLEYVPTYQTASCGAPIMIARH